MKEFEIKSIIGSFLNIAAETITKSTQINKLSSVTQPRFYAELEKKGYLIKDQSQVITYGDLIKSLKGKSETITKLPIASIITNNIPFNSSRSIIGIDLEHISNFPAVEDYRTDPFYKSLFSDKEISYCIIQNNPLESFAGKFAAKEAMIKIDNTLAAIEKNKIEIRNTENGRPIVNGFEISITHSEGYAVAVAFNSDLSFAQKGSIENSQQNDTIKNTIIEPIKNDKPGPNKLIFLTWLNFLAVLALIIYLFLIK